MRRACALALAGLTGCPATSVYAPVVTARGELVLRYDNHFEMWASGRRVTRGLRYRGLAEFVRCVPDAHRNARAAAVNGDAALALSVLGGSLGVLSLGGFYGLRDTSNPDWAWLGAGIGLATAGAVLAGVGRMMKNSANGHAVDAMNYYNDAVGSLGATCDDLRYPPPQALPPMAPLPAPPAGQPSGPYGQPPPPVSLAPPPYGQPLPPPAAAPLPPPPTAP